MKEQDPEDEGCRSGSCKEPREQINITAAIILGSLISAFGIAFALSVKDMIDITIGRIDGVVTYLDFVALGLYVGLIVLLILFAFKANLHRYGPVRRML